MDRRMNRLEQEIRQWEAREQRFSKLFSPGILGSRAFRKEKLGHLHRLHAKYRWSADPDEQLTRRPLRQERRQLEKELYPNRLKRNFMRLAGSLDRLARAVVLTPPGSPRLKEVKGDLRRAGFEGIGAQLREKAAQGHDAFTIPLTGRVNEREELEYRVLVSRRTDGNHRYDGHRVTLSGSGKPVSFQMDADRERLGQRRAYNLLSGRPVLVRGEWLSLDSNDSDANGNLCTKRNPEIYGPDLERELSVLPLKENRAAVVRETLIDGLKNGDRVAVTVVRGSKEYPHFMQANGTRGLDLVDAAGRKVIPGEGIGKKTAKKVHASKRRVNKAKPDMPGHKNGLAGAGGMKIVR